MKNSSEQSFKRKTYARLLIPSTNIAFHLCVLKILELIGKINNSYYYGNRKKACIK